jgi:hypothetical protein
LKADGRTRSRPVRLAIALALIALAQEPATAESLEARIKAAYLLKLSSFVRWPATVFTDANAPLRICIVGRSDVHAVLEALARNQQVAGRTIAAVHIPHDSAAQAQSCQALFVGRNSPAWRDLLTATKRSPVLTITDRAGGTHGGVIEFIESGGNIRIGVDRAEARARSLELSSKLVQIAEPTGR